MNREQFKTRAEEIAASAQQVLLTEIMRMFDKLTEDEREKLSCNGQYYRLAKTILVAVGPEELVSQFNAEAIKGAVKSIRRIDKNRMC